MDPASGRCMNCNKRMSGAHRGLFWCDNGKVCETEWRARVALWEWEEAKERRKAG